MFFSHTRGGQYWLGDYDRERDKFVVDAHGLCNFGAAFPGGVHAPTAAPDGDGVVVMFNMNPGKPTYRMNDYLGGFFGEPGANGGGGDDNSQYAREWDQILTLPRRLSLRGEYDLNVEPAGNIESLRYDHRQIGRRVLPANREIVLDDIEGSAIELQITLDPKLTSMFEVDVLRSPDKEEFTRICFFNRRGNKYREPFADDVRSNLAISTILSNPTRYEGIISVDNSRPSALPDALSRPPESAPVLIEPDEPVRLRIFVDRSVVEVYVNERQCVAVRVYPGREDSTGVSLLSVGQQTELLSLDCWQMKSIYE